MPEPRDWNQRYASGQTPWDSGLPSPELQRIISEAKIVPCPALEIGCGTGTNAVWLAQQGFTVTAVDLVPLAIERAIARAQAARVEVDFRAASLLEPKAGERLAEAGPFSFVFDRGVYHCLREENLAALLATLDCVTRRGSLYLLLAGNANDPAPPEQGPPRITAETMLAELGSRFELIALREFQFDGVKVDGAALNPLGWSALWRRK